MVELPYKALKFAKRDYYMVRLSNEKISLFWLISCFLDREWLLVKEEDSSFITGRNFPKLLTTRLRYTEDEKFIEVSIPDQSKKLYLPTNQQKTPIVKESPPSEEETTDNPFKELSVRVWKVRCGGQDEGDVAANFFSEFLGKNVRLVRGTDAVTQRKVGDDETAKPYLVTDDDLVGCMFV